MEYKLPVEYENHSLMVDLFIGLNSLSPQMQDTFINTILSQTAAQRAKLSILDQIKLLNKEEKKTLLCKTIDLL